MTMKETPMPDETEAAFFAREARMTHVQPDEDYPARDWERPVFTVVVIVLALIGGTLLAMWRL